MMFSCKIRLQWDNQVGLGGCNFVSMNLFHVLKPSSMVSTRHSCVFSMYISPLQMGVIICIFKLCSKRHIKSSVSEINLVGCINIVPMTSALILSITSMDFILIFLFISTSLTIFWVDDSFSKSLRGSIPNWASKWLEHFHNSLLVVLTYSWVFLISMIVSIPSFNSRRYLILYLFEYVGGVSGEFWWVSCHFVTLLQDSWDLWYFSCIFSTCIFNFPLSNLSFSILLRA